MKHDFMLFYLKNICNSTDHVLGVTEVLVCALKGCWSFGENMPVGYDRLTPSIPGSAPRPACDCCESPLCIRQVSYITCWVKRRAGDGLPGNYLTHFYPLSTEMISEQDH